MALISSERETRGDGAAPAFLIGSTPDGGLLVAAAEALLRELHPDVAIATGPSPFPAMDAVTVQLRDTDRWLLLTPRVNAREIAEAFGRGAWTVVPLNSARGDLRRAVESLVEGETPFVPREVSQHMARRGARTRREQALVALTARERGVLELLARGFSNAEIAAQLAMSENTVRTHLHALSSKLQVQSRLKIVARARETGVIEAFD